jgi:glycine oxidase
MKIGIAGAGLIGRLLAWQLLRRGHSITLFDRDSADGELSAARVAAAMLAPYSEAVNGERAIFDWGRESLALWPTLLQELKTDSEIEVFFQQRGSLAIAHTPDHSSLEHFKRRLLRAVPDFRDRIKNLDHAELRDLEPELAERFTSATWLSEEGTLDNRELLAALAQAICRRRASWREQAEVTRVDSGAIHLGDEVFSCDLAIDARGFGAKPQLADLRGVRGEVLWVYAPEVHLTRPVRLMHPRYQLYIAPKRNSVYVIGATEIESESLAPITVRSSLELQSALYSVHTGFAEASVLHAYANCRPAFMDNLPRVEVGDGLLRVNGLYRHGYLLSPMVMQTALAVIEGQIDHPIVKLLDLRQQHFPALTSARKKRHD